MTALSTTIEAACFAFSGIESVDFATSVISPIALSGAEELSGRKSEKVKVIQVEEEMPEDNVTYVANDLSDLKKNLQDDPNPFLKTS